MKTIKFKYENDYYTAIEYLFNLAKEIEDNQEIVFFEPESHIHKTLLGNIKRIFDIYKDDPTKRERQFVPYNVEMTDEEKKHLLNIGRAVFFNNDPEREMQALVSYAKEHPEDENIRLYLKKIQDSEIEKHAFMPDDIKLIVKNGSNTKKNVSVRVSSTKAKESNEEINKKRNKLEIPAELLTDEAEIIWQSLRKAGFIVANGYSLVEGVSANQATFIAACMAEKLKIHKKWKVFQQLWGIQHMAQMAGAWKQTGKEPPRANEVRDLFK